MKDMEAAIQAKDFETFGRLTIQDSNQFHAICLDTFPPIFYMNDASKAIVNVLTRYNSYAGEIKAAYTFDAGPNACVYCRQSDVPTILGLVEAYFPRSESCGTSGSPRQGPPPYRTALENDRMTNASTTLCVR